MVDDVPLGDRHHARRAVIGRHVEIAGQRRPGCIALAVSGVLLLGVRRRGEIR